MNYLFDEIIEGHAEKRPEKTFIVYKDQEISFGDFNRTCNQVANAMREMGIQRGGKAAFYMPNCPESLYVYYGDAKAGIVTVPINWLFKQEELSYCLKKSDAEIVFTAQPYTENVKRVQEDCPDLKYIIEISPEASPGVIPFSEFISPSPPELTKRIPKKEDDTVLILFTSGTTGRPKGVMHTHKSLSFTAQAFINYAGLTDQDCCYTATPMFHHSGLLYCNHCMAIVGGKQYLAEKFSVSRFWDEVKEHSCTYFISLETMLLLLMQQPEREDDASNSIRIILAALPPDLHDAFEEKFNCVIIQSYASTEDPIVSVTPLDKQLRRKKVNKARGIYVGMPIDPAQKQTIWDEEGNEVDPGVLGELMRIGPGTMKGYYNDAEETEKAFKGGWLHMGDSGYRDEDGHFYFVDRIKDVVRRGGEQISSREVENVIRQHPGVAMVAVIPVPDPIRVEEVKAYIVPHPGEKVTATDIWEFCDPKLADFKIPRYIEFRDEFPMTGSLRIKKNLLKTEKEDLISGCFDRMKHVAKRE